MNATLHAAPHLQFPGIIQDYCNNIISASGAIAGPILLSLITTTLAFASSYPTSIRSTGFGWTGGVGRLTSMVGPAISALILAAGWGPWEIYPVIAAPLLLGAGAMLVFHLTRAAETGVAELDGGRLWRPDRMLSDNRLS